MGTSSATRRAGWTLGMALALAAALPGVGVAAAPTGELTVTVAKNCEAYAIDATINNGTDAPVTVAVANRDAGGAPRDSATVAAGGTGLLRVRANITDRYDLVYTRLDTGAEVASFFEELWICARRVDARIRVGSGETYRIAITCPLFIGVTRRPQHGRIRGIAQAGGGEGYAYTPNAGYVGPDRFDYGCNTSGEQFGTVFVTVLPALVRPTQPPAARLPATGAAGLRPQLGTVLGSGLVLVGVLLLRSARRRPG